MTSRVRSASALLTGTLGASLFAVALGLVTGVLTARGLDPDGRGALVGMVAWVGFLGAVALLGLDESMIFHAKGDRRLAREIVRALARPVLASTSVGAMVVFGVAIWILVPDSPAGWGTVLLLGIQVPLVGYMQLSLAILKVEGSFRAWNIGRTISAVVYAVAVALLYIVGSLTLLTAVGSLTAATAVASVANWWKVRWTNHAPVERATTERVLAYGRGVTVSGLPATLNPRLDQLLMSAVMTTSLLGVYSVAATLGSLIVLVGWCVEQLLFPRLVGRTHSGQQIVLFAAASFVGAGVIALLLYVIAPHLIAFLYGEAYESAVEPLPLILLMSAVWVGVSVLSASSKSRRRLKALALAQGLGVVVTTGAFFLFARWEMVGAAGAVLLGVIAVGAVLVADHLAPGRKT